MSAETVWYFAYGSNMDAARMRERLKDVGGWQERVPAVLTGWRLAFNKVAGQNPHHGFANIVPAAGEKVEGCLYRLPEAALEALDRYEGVPDHYVRREVTVKRRDTGESLAAVTYVAQSERVREGLKPSREYLQHLLAGEECLSQEYFQRLRNVL
ncbi:MAG: gamma-glutamylcyclotransferase family protein [Bacillota bacterium]